MDSELLQILAEGTAASARMLYLTVVNMYFGAGLIILILKKKRSYRLLYWYLAYKAVMYNWLYLQIIGIYRMNFEQAWIVHVAMSAFHYLLLIGLLCYTFYGSLVKVVLISAFADSTGTIIGCGMQFLLNVLERRENVFDVSGKFHPLDFLLPVLCCLVYRELRKRGKKVFQWAREREVKHPGLWGVFCVFHLLVGLFSVQGFANRELSSMIRLSGLLVLVFLAITAGLGLAIFRSHQRQVLQRHRFLRKQQELVLLHSKSIQKQVLQIEYLQRKLEEQMEKILSDAKSADVDARLRLYLSQLKEQYQTVGYGTYCRDWMVDAVLVYMASRLREKGVVCEIEFQNYRGGVVDSVDMAQLIMRLMNLKIRSSVRIRTGSMTTGMYIGFTCTDIRKKRTVKRAAGSLLENYRGEIWQGRGQEKHTFLLRFPIF